MIIFHARQPEIIRKSGPRKKVTRTYKRIFALTNAMGNAVRVDLSKGIKSFKKKVSDRAVYNAWATGNWQKIMQVIPWQEMHEDLKPFGDQLRKAVKRSQDVVFTAMPEPTKKDFRFDTKNPHIENYLKKRTGSMVIDISKDSQKTIQQAVARHFDSALRPSEIARSIKDSIGLYPRLELALDNYRQGLVGQGLDPNRIDILTERYNDRLLDYRSTTIARTETRRATEFGQLSVWKEAANQDLLDRQTTKKVWVVDGAPCEVCEPMDGIKVPLDGFWTLNNGLVVETPPESHPNCMCGMELDFGDTEQKLLQSGEEDVAE